MLSLTQTTGYAIQALVFLSEQKPKSCQTSEIAQATRIPRAYLAKITRGLARAGLLTAKRGIGGGIRLGRNPEEVTLLQVVEAVEGSNWLGDCLLGLEECTNLATCPTHEFWQRIRREIIQQLGQTSLASVIAFKTKHCPGAKTRRRRLSRGTGRGATRRGPNRGP